MAIEKIIKIKDNLNMNDKIDQVEPTFEQGSALSPVGLPAPSSESNNQDINILFGNDSEFKS